MGFKITVMNILVALMEKAHNMKEQMHKVAIEMKTLRKNQKEILGIIILGQSVSLKIVQNGTYQTKMQKKRRIKKKNPHTMEQLQTMGQFQNM